MKNLTLKAFNKLTKQEKYLLLKDKVNYYPCNSCGFCSACKSIFREDVLFRSTELKNTFPELLKYKPKSGWKENPEYWWSPYKREKRLEVIDKILNELK